MLSKQIQSLSIFLEYSIFVLKFVKLILVGTYKEPIIHLLFPMNSNWDSDSGQLSDLHQSPSIYKGNTIQPSCFIYFCVSTLKILLIIFILKNFDSIKYCNIVWMYS